MQGILGTTRTKPLFTVELDQELDEYKIYFGLSLLTIIPNDKRALIFKTTIAMLVGAGVCIRHIQKAFDLSFATIQKYVDGVRTSRNDEEFLSKFKNPGRIAYKVTPKMADEIRRRAKFHRSCGEHRYIKETIQDIKKEFGVKLSVDTIRTELKKHGTEAGSATEKAAASLQGTGDNVENLPMPVANIPARNSYAGTLLLSSPLSLVFRDFPEMTTQDDAYDLKAMIAWWMIGVLAGAVNLEGHRYFNVTDFEFVSGFAGLPVVERMREILREMSLVSETQIATILLRKNIDYFVEDDDDYYLDGHFEEYTGKANILAGWSTIRNRVLPGTTDYMVHDRAGNPVFSYILDQFEDFREVIIKIIDKISKLRPGRKATLIYDRGGFSMELMKKITDVLGFHFITWQKGFTRVEADGLDFNQDMTMDHRYNDLGNIKSYTICFAQDEWKCKDYQCRRIVIRREDKSKNDKYFYQSILTSDWEKDGAHIVRRMLGRPMQENDFKKQKRHFGLDEMTSYAKLAYGKLNDKDPEKTARNRQYDETLKNIRDLKNERDRLFAKLGLGVFKGSSLKNIPTDLLKKHGTVVEQIKERIAAMQLKRKELKDIAKDISKLAKCQDENRVELDLRPKRLLNLLKISARNIFEKCAREFLDTYKNLRDYQKVFRKLTRSGGEIEIRGDTMFVKLDPFGRAAFRTKCNEFFTKMNNLQVKTMDGKYNLHFIAFP